MGAGDLEPLDLLYTATDDDEPRLKVGDLASGAGVAQDCAYLATDGFLSLPNPPDGDGAATGLVWTPGQDRLVLAAMENRYNDKAGTLSPGDRAIVSNCDAALLLDQSANKIQLLALSQELSVAVDAAGQQITATAPNASATIGPSGITAAWAPPGLSVEVSLTTATLTLSYSSPLGACSITLSATSGGQIAITAPGGIMVNGVPLVVP